MPGLADGAPCHAPTPLIRGQVSFDTRVGDRLECRLEWGTWSCPLGVGIASIGQWCFRPTGRVGFFGVSDSQPVTA